MKLTEKQIKDIAEELLCGFNVYINKKTKETNALPDPNGLYYDGESWDHEFEKMDAEWENYIVVTPMHSNESYRIMEAFIDEVEDPELSTELTHRLNYQRPFANFKAVVESSEYRQKWFDFRQAKWEEYVREELNIDDIEIE